MYTASEHPARGRLLSRPGCRGVRGIPQREAPTRGRGPSIKDYRQRDLTLFISALLAIATEDCDEADGCGAAHEQIVHQVRQVEGDVVRVRLGTGAEGIGDIFVADEADDTGQQGEGAQGTASQRLPCACGRGQGRRSENGARVHSQSWNRRVAGTASFKPVNGWAGISAAGGISEGGVGVPTGSSNREQVALPPLDNLGFRPCSRLGLGLAALGSGLAAAWIRASRPWVQASQPGAWTRLRAVAAAASARSQAEHQPCAGAPSIATNSCISLRRAFSLASIRADLWRRCAAAPPSIGTRAGSGAARCDFKRRDRLACLRFDS